MLFVAADNERRQEALDLSYYTAWHAGLFSQPFEKGKFPPFEKNLPSGRSTRLSEPQSWQRQKQFVKALNAVLGGTLRSRQQ